MRGVYTRTGSPFYWVRFYDKLEAVIKNRRKSVNSKILITDSDKKRIETAKAEGGKAKLIGTNELHRFVRGLVDGMNDRYIRKKTGVKIIRGRLFSEAAEEYLYYRTRPGDPKAIRLRTKEIYDAAIDHFLKAAGDKEVHKYTKKKDYYSLLEHFDKKEFKRNTIAIYVRTLRSLWNHFIKEKIVVENIFESIQSEQGEPDPIPLVEMYRILLYLKQNEDYPHHHDFVYFMLLTGCRPSSAVVQKRSDVFIDDKFMRIENVKTGERKGKRYYEFPIYPELEKLLKQIIESLPEKEDRLFHQFSYKDGYYTRGLNFWDRAMQVLFIGKKITKKYNLKQIRPTFASFLVNVLAVDIFLVKRLLDHTDIKVTEKHYTRLEMKTLQNELEEIKLSSFYEPPTNKPNETGGAE